MRLDFFNNGLSLRASTQKYLIVLVGLAVVVAFNVMLWALWTPSYVLNDGVQYLSTANSWLSGSGFSTNALMYTPHFQGILPAPQTVWPLGYPMIIALVSMLGMSAEAAALSINVFSQALSALLVFVILRRLKLNFYSAFFCSLIFYSTGNPWAYSVALVSEPLFSMLILVAIFFQPGFQRSSLWPWIFSGVLVALCVLTRYSGVLFAAGIGAGMFIYLIKTSSIRSTDFWRGIAMLTLQMSIPVILLGATLYRTYLLTGTIGRDIGVIDTGDLFQRLKLVFWQVREFIGFTDTGILPPSVNTPLMCLLVLLVLLALVQMSIVSLKKTPKTTSSQTEIFNVLLYVICGHTAVFVIFFAFSVAGLALVDLNHRYLNQIYPGLFVLFCVLCAKVFRIIEKLQLFEHGKWFRKSLVAILCLFALAQANLATAIKDYSMPGVQIREALDLNVSETTDLQTMIQSCLVRSGETVGSIWSNDGQQLSYAAGIPTITVADVYGNNPYDLENVRNHIETYDVKMFVILNNLPDIAPQFIQMLTDVKQWLIKQGYEKITLSQNEISSDITVDVYLLDKTCL